jgi:hypothetical protein
MYMRFSVKVTTSMAGRLKRVSFSQKENRDSHTHFYVELTVSCDHADYNLFITVGISKLALYQSEDCVQKVAVVWT